MLRALELTAALALVACSATPGPASTGAPTSSSIAAAGPAAAGPADGAASDDAFGGLAPGLPEPEVVRLLGPPKTKGAFEEEAASGLWTAKWEWPDRGVELSMERGVDGQPATLGSLRLKAPCPLKNAKGIGVGSTRAEVVAAMGSKISTEHAESQDPSTITVGSIYGGIFLGMEADRVAEIYVGVGAE